MSQPLKTQSLRLDSDALTVLKLYVDLANSERQAIWARTGAMLVGNSFIVNALKSDDMKWLTFYLGTAGLLICFIWAVMTWRGWQAYDLTMAEGRKLNVTPQMNPFHQLEYPNGTGRIDVIFWCTLLLIAVFISLYVVMLWGR